MNKNQLIEQLKKPEDKINSLLSAAAIPTDLEDYSDDHLKILKEIDKAVESGKAKTYKEAVKLYRQQQDTTIGSNQTAETSNSLDDFIQALADSAAERAFANLPNIASAEYERLKAAFLQRFRQRIAERMQNPEYRQQFLAAMEGEDMGNPKLLNSTI